MTNKKSFGLLALALGLWVALYSVLKDVAAYLTALLPMDQESHAAEAIRYFLYDAPKILLLLCLVVFVMGVVRSFFSPERTRALLAARGEKAGTVAAALLGVVTPFCSCSAVPMFIGFLSAGVPLGVTFAFLISAPMVNEVALGLLFGLVGFKIAALYLLFGLAIAIISGLILGRLKLEHWLEDWVQNLRKEPPVDPGQVLTWPDRLAAGAKALREIVGSVWPWVLGGVALGAGIHGFAPEELMAAIMGPGAWWSVPAAVLIGVPLYDNHAGMIPVVAALLGKGAAVGTVLAFMMSVTALSLPEMVILRKVLKVPLIAVFAGIVACGILLVGYAFNAIF